MNEPVLSFWCAKADEHEVFHRICCTRIDCDDCSGCTCACHNEEES